MILIDKSKDGITRFKGGAPAGQYVSFITNNKNNETIFWQS